MKREQVKMTKEFSGSMPGYNDKQQSTHQTIMRKSNNISISWLAAGFLLFTGIFATDISAQNHRNYNSGGEKVSTQLRPASNSASRSGGMASPRQNMTSTNRNSGNHRPGGSTTTRPGGNHNRPGGSTTMRPGGNHNRPGGSTTTRPGGNHNRPGGSTTLRPGGSHNRPGGSTTLRPGGNHNRPGYGNSALRPGTGSISRPRPMRPDHHARPAFGWPTTYFGRWRPLPPPPVRPTYYYSASLSIPPISAVLGITFGTLIDYGIRSLINAGYSVAGYQNNAIFVNNVNIMGCQWPQATLYYGNSGMNGALFQFRSPSISSSPYSNVYTQLCSAFGQPVESISQNDYRSATWWGGNNTGYITLTTEGGYDTSGQRIFDTNLLYGAE